MVGARDEASVPETMFDSIYCVRCSKFSFGKHPFLSSFRCCRMMFAGNPCMGRDCVLAGRRAFPVEIRASKGVQADLSWRSSTSLTVAPVSR